MNRQDIEKLLGGYATGTLTPEERRALFAAALEDQQLFDTLAREQALQDLLAEPDARARLLTALGEQRPAAVMRWWRRPVVAALAAGLVVGAVALTVWPARKQQAPLPARPVLVSEVKEAPAPAPAPVEPKQVASPPARPRSRVAARPPAKPAVGENAAETATLKLHEALPPGPGAQPAAPPQTSTFRADALARAVEAGPQPARPAEPAPEQVRIKSAAALVKAGQREPVVRYTIVRTASDGAWVPIEGTTVETGMSVRFRVEPEQYGRIELIEFDASGKPRLVAAADATPGVPCDLPADGLRFENAGYRQFIVRLSGTGSFTRIVLNIKRP